MKIQYSIAWLIDTFENGETLKYTYFWGNKAKHDMPINKSCLSQWYHSPFTVDSITYNTAEHWMMAHKALAFNDSALFEQIIHCSTPAEAKTLGRQIRHYDDDIWNTLKYNIVIEGNIHKFNQNKLILDFLLATNHTILVEASPTDTIWGIGLSQDSQYIGNIYAWRGQNLLGFALMEARDFLRSFGQFTYTAHTILPPWKQHPNIDPHDMFWRMGIDEEYILHFSNYYNSLNEREQTIYKLIYPPILDWLDYYDK